MKNATYLVEWTETIVMKHQHFVEVEPGLCVDDGDAILELLHRGDFDKLVPNENKKELIFQGMRRIKNRKNKQNVVLIQNRSREET